MRSSDCLIAVVDDNVPVARAVSRVLSTQGYRVKTFSSGREYLDQRLALRPTCLLADIRMPGLDGLQTHRAAHEDGNEIPTVFMTASGDVSVAVSAMKAGASDLLAKPFSMDALLTAIGVAVDRAEASDKDLRVLAELWERAAKLTPREGEIAVLVASGRLNKQVAARTGITEKTVKVHRARAMRKLGASSLAEAVRIIDRILAARGHASIQLAGLFVTRPSVVDVMVRALEVDPAPKG
ncbi:MAG TPA: response regulator [Gemmatimonadaceae bacterium]|nr:response regulator [Gemmatimonadaceae bacterium]